MGHHHIEIDQKEIEKNFTLGPNTTKWIFSIAGVGILLLVIGLFLAISGEDKVGVVEDHGHGHAAATHGEAAHAATGGHAEEHHVGPEVHKPYWVTRLISNILINSYFFMGISLLGVFFVALNYVANAGWHTLLKRIPEAMGNLFPIFGLILLVIFLTSATSIYHWADPDIVANDKLLQEKEAYLNKSFFLVRSVIFLSLWGFFFFMLKKLSNQEDEVGGISLYRKRVRFSAVFLVVFALSFSAASWDWLMSIEAHWFSTMFSVRAFSTCWVSCLAIITISTIFLQSQGYLKYVNDSHYHDLGKLMFAFSIFWTYIWFSEYLLIWYANIPEEGIYFFKRLQEYPVLFFTALIINFFIPFLVLLHKANMRHKPTLGFICFLILFGHWLDVYLIVMPGTMGTYGSFGLLEIGMFITFLGLFLFGTAFSLAKVNLLPRKHPYLDESIKHHYA